MEYVICRVCGYIEVADKRDGACPACGFPKTVWMDYKPRKMSEKRYKLLDLHLHPIFVHFPIVFTALAAGLPIIAFFAPFSIATRLYDATTMLCWFLPLLVIGGGITGAVGGKLRYKTIKAPLLKMKIILSIVYFLLTLVPFYISVTGGVLATNALFVVIFAGAASLVAAYLGKKGSYLFATKFGPYVAG